MPPGRRDRWWIAGVWLGSLVLSFALAGGGVPSRVTVVEAGLWLVLLALLWRQEGVRRVLRGVGPGQRVVAVGFVAALWIGQLARAEQNTWPVVQWDMYTRVRHGDPTSFSYEAELASGRRIELSAVHGRTYHQYLPASYLAQRVARETDPARRRALEMQLDAALRGVVQAYNRRHPDAPIVGLVVWKHTIPVAHYAGWGSVRHEVFHRMELR